MHTTKKGAFAFGALIQKIRNALIHKRKEPYNWFHILTLRGRDLFSSEPNGWWYNVKSFIDSYQPDYIRHYTDMAFRLDKKIKKVVDQHIAETDWINFYEHDNDGGPGCTYPHTNINVKEEQSEDTYSKWCHALGNKIYDISNTERQRRVACVYGFDFFQSYFVGVDGQRNVYFNAYDWRSEKIESDWRQDYDE